MKVAQDQIAKTQKRLEREFKSYNDPIRDQQKIAQVAKVEKKRLQEEIKRIMNQYESLINRQNSIIDQANVEILRLDRERDKTEAQLKVILDLIQSPAA